MTDLSELGFLMRLHGQADTLAAAMDGGATVDEAEEMLRCAEPNIQDATLTTALMLASAKLTARAEEKRCKHERMLERAGGNMDARLIDICDEALPAVAYEYAAQRIERGDPPSPTDVERHVRKTFPGITDDEVIDALTEITLMFQYPDHPLHEFVALRRAAAT